MNLATIQKIHSIQPHPNPEVNRLDVAQVLAWPVVIPKGEFRENDLVIFITIDSIVPKGNLYFSFLERQKYRIWNAKFKGAPSSGLVCPLSVLPTTNIVDEMEVPVIREDLKEGDDVTEILGIIKYEKPFDSSVNGDAKGGFPTNLISISDEDSMRSYPNSLTELDGREYYTSLKFDGSSTTFIYFENEFKACSRRLEMKEGSGFPWRVAEKYDLKNKLISLNKPLAIQVESIGPKLNGNRLELKEIECRVFRVKDLTDGHIFTLNELKDFCNSLQLPMVDILEVGIFNRDVHTIGYFENVANNLKYPTGNNAEGLVLAPTIPFYSPTLNKSFSCKIINGNYKQE